MFRNSLISLLFFAMVAGVAACKDDSVQPSTRIEGMWGGNHVALSAGPSGGTLEYDCAHGTIDRPLYIGSDGRFRFVGTHTRESGGPVHQGDPPDVHPAHYDGRLSGSTLVFTVTLEDTGDTLGPFTLVRGENGDIHKCL